jgi:hypothetical protein
MFSKSGRSVLFDEWQKTTHSRHLTTSKFSHPSSLQICLFGNKFLMLPFRDLFPVLKLRSLVSGCAGFMTIAISNGEIGYT